MLNNFLKNTDSVEQEEATEYFDESKVAGITYFVGVDGKVQVDVEIFDYNKESIDGLSKVLQILSKDNCYMKTLEMIGNHFINDEQEDALVSVYEKIAGQVPLDKNVQICIANKKPQKPCIRPSDML
jgi:hypothetical protein